MAAEGLPQRAAGEGGGRGPSALDKFRRARKRPEQCHLLEGCAAVQAWKGPTHVIASAAEARDVVAAILAAERPGAECKASRVLGFDLEFKPRFQASAPESPPTVVQVLCPAPCVSLARSMRATGSCARARLHVCNRPSLFRFLPLSLSAACVCRWRWQMQCMCFK